MAVGSKSFPQDSVPEAITVVAQPSSISSSSTRCWFVLLEVLVVFALLEAVMWTPRGLFHSCLIVLEVLAVVWLGLRQRSKEELGLVWPSRNGTFWILSLGALAAAAIPGL